MREVLDSLYTNIDQEAEEAPAEAGQAGEESLPAKLTFATVVETVIRFINTISTTNKVGATVTFVSTNISNPIYVLFVLWRRRISWS